MHTTSSSPSPIPAVAVGSPSPSVSPSSSSSSAQSSHSHYTDYNQFVAKLQCCTDRTARARIALNLAKQACVDIVDKDATEVANKGESRYMDCICYKSRCYLLHYPTTSVDFDTAHIPGWMDLEVRSDSTCVGTKAWASEEYSSSNR